MDAQHFFDLAVDYYNQGKLNEALEACTRAEEAGNEGKYPNASYNKGIIYTEISDVYFNYSEQTWEKTEKEKYFNLAVDFLKHAIDSYTKAEKDSNKGKYPTASNNKGDAFNNLYKKNGEEKYLYLAIASCTKAEEDNDGKFPEASNNKGNAFEYLYRKNGEE